MSRWTAVRQAARSDPRRKRVHRLVDWWRLVLPIRSIALPRHLHLTLMWCRGILIGGSAIGVVKRFHGRILVLPITAPGV